MLTLALSFALAAAAPTPPAAAPLACVDGAKVAATSKATPTPQGDPKARAAAQKGLDFLAQAATEWQEQHKCYGCHVQAVTMEALTVGKSHQYNVTNEAMKSMVFGMTDISGGAHGPHGLTVGEAVYLPETSKTFGGAAFAHYDERIGANLRKELTSTAEVNPLPAAVV